MIWFFDLSGYSRRKTSKEDSIRIEKKINRILSLTKLHLGEQGDIYAPSHKPPNHNAKGASHDPQQ